MDISHLDFDELRRIDIDTMSSCLLNKLSTVGKNERLIGTISCGMDAVNEVGENDLQRNQRSNVRFSSDVLFCHCQWPGTLQASCDLSQDETKRIECIPPGIGGDV